MGCAAWKMVWVFLLLVRNVVGIANNDAPLLRQLEDHLVELERNAFVERKSVVTEPNVLPFGPKAPTALEILQEAQNEADGEAKELLQPLVERASAPTETDKKATPRTTPEELLLATWTFGNYTTFLQAPGDGGDENPAGDDAGSAKEKKDGESSAKSEGDAKKTEEKKGKKEEKKPAADEKAPKETHPAPAATSDEKPAEVPPVVAPTPAGPPNTPKVVYIPIPPGSTHIMNPPGIPVRVVYAPVQPMVPVAPPSVLPPPAVVYGPQTPVAAAAAPSMPLTALPPAVQGQMQPPAASTALAAPAAPAAPSTGGEAAPEAKQNAAPEKSAKGGGSADAKKPKMSAEDKKKKKTADAVAKSLMEMGLEPPPSYAVWEPEKTEKPRNTTPSKTAFAQFFDDENDDSPPPGSTQSDKPKRNSRLLQTNARTQTVLASGSTKEIASTMEHKSEQAQKITSKTAGKNGKKAGKQTEMESFTANLFDASGNLPKQYDTWKPEVSAEKKTSPSFAAMKAALMDDDDDDAPPPQAVAFLEISSKTRARIVDPHHKAAISLLNSYASALHSTGLRELAKRFERPVTSGMMARLKRISSMRLSKEGSHKTLDGASSHVEMSKEAYSLCEQFWTAEAPHVSAVREELIAAHEAKTNAVEDIAACQRMREYTSALFAPSTGTSSPNAKEWQSNTLAWINDLEAAANARLKQAESRVATEDEKAAPLRQQLSHIQVQCGAINPNAKREREELELRAMRETLELLS